MQGKFYLIIEELSQLFRSLVPIQVWYKYIMGDDPSSSYFLGGILIIMYSLCKVSSTPEHPWQLWQEQGEQQLKGQMHLWAVAVPAQGSCSTRTLWHFAPQHVGIAGLGEDLRLLPVLHQTHEVIAALLIPLCRSCRRRGAGAGLAVLAEVLAGSTAPDVTQRQAADTHTAVSEL